MRKVFRPLTLIVLFLTVFFVGACSKNAENEHLPEYCQTYSGFTSIASKDFYDLLRENDHDIDRISYFQVISEISLEFEVNDPTREIDLSGIQCFQNLTHLTLIGQSFKDLSPISALHNIQSIELRETSVVSIDSFKNLSKIKSLVISDTLTLQSVEGVEEMTKLTNLDLSNNGIVNIEGLNNLINLTNLYLNDNKIVEFPSINQLDQLEVLDISDNNINVLGEDLSGLRNLEILHAENNEICDLSTLDDLISLEELWLSNNDLGCGGFGVSPNFDSLENAPNLRELYLDSNGLTSIEGLRGRDLSLETLHINDNELTDITPIGAYTGISELVINNNNIVNIDDLSGMTGLDSIDLSHNDIIDFSDLLSIPNVETVNLSFNNITSIPDISTSWPLLSVLNLSSNDLNDTSGVNGHPTIEELNLYNNGLTELRGISNMPELNTLIIFDEDADEELDPLFVNPNDISIIRDSFNNLESLELDISNTFDFGFELGDNVEIYNSINGLNDIATIDFDDMDIDHIDELSINLPNLRVMRVRDNNITDIRFILGNPKLEQLFISGNSISNLEVISGVGHDDLDKLTDVDASDISVGNDLVDAFIELPDLEAVDLTNTRIESFNNSFNDLESLEIVLLDSTFLISIEGSFNNIYGTYAETNEINFLDGQIELIDNSFNGGMYSDINIQNQNVFGGGATAITNSFNDITVAVNGIIIYNSRFDTIDGSFNNVTTDNLAITECGVQTLTNVFVGTTVNDTLGLLNNYIEDIPSLDQITYVDSLILFQNHLTTLSFLDGINGLTYLDISNQRNETTLSYTLESIDGVNNLPLLETFTYANIGITSIDGLKNIGIDSFELSRSTNNDIPLLTISATSFSGTPITYLDLDEHALDNVDFLDNFTVLTNLYIGIDLADLSDFQGIGLESSLLVLSLLNNQAIGDFVYLSNYDLLESMSVDSPLTSTINNLDGMDSLQVITLDFDQITSITNSFNNLPVYNPNSTFLNQFTSLTLIDTSFDIYGTASHTDEIEIRGGVNVVDSFNNVVSVSINDNEGDITPNFDTQSFDDMVDIIFEHGDYTSFTFLNGYLLLSEVTFTDLSESITDLSNSNIESLVVEDTEIGLTTLTVDISPTGSIEYTGDNTLIVGTFTITTNAPNIEVNQGYLDTVLNSTATTLNISSNFNGDFTLNSASLTDVVLDDFVGTDVTFNTNLLEDISRLNGAVTHASGVFTINSNQPTLTVTTRAGNVIINDDFATNYTLVVDVGDVVINNTQTDIIIDYTGQDINVSYDTLEDFAVGGSFDNFTVSSIVLDTVFTNSSTIDSATITSDVAALTIFTENTTDVTINNNSIDTLTAFSNNSDIVINSTNNAITTISANASSIELFANNIPSVIISNSSSITDLIFTSTATVNDITFGTANVSTIDLTTSQTVVTITGSTASDITLSGAAFTNLNIDTTLSDITLTSSAATLNFDVNASNADISSTGIVTLNGNISLGQFDIFENSLSTIDITSSGGITNLEVTGGNALATVNVNSSIIGDIIISTGQTSLNIDGVNVLNTEVTGNLITSLNANLGATRDLILNSTNPSPLNVNVISNILDLNVATNDLIVNNLSSITTMDLSSSNLTTVNTGTATINNLNITNSASTLGVNGVVIGAVDIDSGVTALNATLVLSTGLTVNSSAGVDVVTNTEAIDLTASGLSSITSSTIDDITLALGANDISLDLDKVNLDLLVSGVAGEVTVTGSDVDSFITDATTNLDTLVFSNIDIDTVNFTLGTVENLVVTTNLTTFTVIGDEVQSIDITGANINTVTASSDFASAILVLDTEQAVLDINGDINEVDVTNDIMISLDIAGLITNDLTIQGNNLTAFNPGSSVTNSLDITTSQNNFNLSSNVPTNILTANITDTLNFSSSSVSTSLETNVDVVNLTAGTTEVTLSGSNINTVAGTVNDIILNGTLGSGTLTLGLTANNNVTIANDVISLIVLTGANSINELDVTSSSLSNINTNNVVIAKIIYTATTNDTIISTDTDDIELSSSGLANMDINYSGVTALTLDLDGTNINDLTANSTTSITITGNGNIMNLESTSVTDITATTFTTNTLELTVDANNVTMSTISDDVDLISTGNSDIDVTYGGSTAFNVDFDSLNNASVTTSGSATQVNATGTATTFDLSSTTILSVNASALTADTLTYTSGSNVTSITTAIETINLASTGNGNMNLSYMGLNPVSVDLSALNNAQLTINNTNQFVVTGTSNNVEILGASLDTVTTTSLFVSAQFTMNDTLIDDLEFVSNELLGSATGIEVNTLDVLNIESIINKLQGTTIDLSSPIVSQDIYDYYYDGEYSDLEAQEVIDSVRYDGFRDTAIENAWQLILTNIYMDHLDETITKAEIDAQVYQTVEQYFQSFLTNEGTDEVTYGVEPSATARAAITATLADPTLTILEVDLNNQVTVSIEDDADSYAVSQQALITFTIS